MESIELPVTTLYLHAFMENFFKYPGGFFLQGSGGKYFWSNNSGDQKTHWHSNRATGTAALGMTLMLLAFQGHAATHFHHKLQPQWR